ncbi:hypothetical protein IT575_06735 [bacterium]|nr:hypothetical protein [bacterium]
METRWQPLTLRAAVLALTLACAIWLAACGAVGGIEGRAAQYYNYMIGRYPKQAYSSYLSPAYKKKFTRDGLRQLDETRRKASKPNTRYPLAKGKHVLVSSQDRFAYTVVDPELGDAFAVLQPQRWVKSGLNWYLYTGSQAEIEAYGSFPAELAPPPLAEFEALHEKERKPATLPKGKGSKDGAEDSGDAEAGEKGGS